MFLVNNWKHNTAFGLGVGFICNNCFLAFSLSFVLGRYLNKIIISKWLITIIGITCCNFYWSVNFGSRGSGLYMFLVYYTSMIFIWHSVFIRVVTLFVIVNIGTLFTIEYINPNIIPFYPSEWARVIDSYAGLAMFIVYLAILVIDAKNNYIEQFKQAQKSDKLKSAFLANMSHEIRTPLNAIMGFSNLLTKRELTKEKKEQYSMLITDNGKYLLNLISDILDISLIESNQLKINFTQVNLNDLFTNLSSTYNQMLTALNKKDVVLILNIPPETQIIETDEVRVEQVLANLLGNAIKFTNKGYIIFGYQPKDNMLHCFVEDTGRGIKEEFQSQVFDRFVKGEDNTDVFFERGAGIGLSLSKDLVHLLGGRLWFTSQYEVGSSFNFALPLNGKLLNL